jgi:hypothetical protein
MKIKLIRSGGFVPVTKVAETEVSLSENEMIRLLEAIKPDPAASRIKDGNYYEITIGTSSSPVDMDNIPNEYKDLFSKLKSDLKILKQSRGK